MLVNSINALVYILSIGGAICLIVGDICISDYEGIGKWSKKPKSIEYCQKYTTSGFVFVLVSRLIIVAVQYYSFALIAIVAK